MKFGSGAGKLKKMTSTFGVVGSMHSPVPLSRFLWMVSVIYLSLNAPLASANHLCSESMDIKQESDMTFKDMGLNTKLQFVIPEGKQCQYNVEGKFYMLSNESASSAPDSNNSS